MMNIGLTRSLIIESIQKGSQIPGETIPEERVYLVVKVII